MNLDANYKTLCGEINKRNENILKQKNARMPVSSYQSTMQFLRMNCELWAVYC